MRFRQVQEISQFSLMWDQVRPVHYSNVCIYLQGGREMNLTIKFRFTVQVYCSGSKKLFYQNGGHKKVYN